MHRLGKCIVVLSIVALTATPALAQRQGGRGGGRGGNPLMLLTQKSVQEELKLSSDQVQKIEDLQAKQRQAFEGLRDLSRDERRQKMQAMAKENEQAVAGILNPDQSKRLHQIQLQVRGAGAFNDPKVADALNLTDDQKQKIQSIEEEARSSMQEARQSRNREKMQEIRKDTLAKVMGVLTDEQKTKWKDMTGEPFKGEIQFGPPGGRRGGNRNRGAGGS